MLTGRRSLLTAALLFLAVLVPGLFILGPSDPLVWAMAVGVAVLALVLDERTARRRTRVRQLS